MAQQSEHGLFQAQIYQRMNEKETDELIDIWQENDREAWTDDAFEAVKAILLERLGKLPEPELNKESASGYESGVEYPSDRKLIWIADLCNKLSYVIVLVTFAYTLLRVINYFYYSGSFSWAGWESAGIFSNITVGVLTVILGIINSALFGGFMFLVLQGITESIYLLMDIRDILHPELDMEETQLS